MGKGFVGRYNPLSSSLYTLQDVQGVTRTVRRSAALVRPAPGDHLPVAATVAPRTPDAANIHRHLTDIERWLKTARKGSRKAYHVGYLAKDRFWAGKSMQPLHAVSEYIYKAAQRGLAVLVQKRLRDGEYIYYVVKR